MAKKLDEYQDNAVKMMSNVVVSAGAGSGKTTVLAKRAAHLVTEEKFKIDELLVLTFTKKATVEMKSRIFSTIREEAENGNPFAQTAVRNFDAAQIKTLDSYCSEIARQGAHFYGITPGFSQDNDEAERTIRNMAIPFLLEHRDDEAVQSLARMMDFNRIAEDFFVKSILDNSTIAEPVDFEGDAERQADELAKAWQAESEKAESLIAEIGKLFAEVENRSKAPAPAIEAALASRNTEAARITADEIRAADSRKIDGIVQYARSFAPFTSFNKPRKNAADIMMAEIGVKLTELYDVIDNIKALANGIFGYRMSAKAARLLSAFQEKANRSKRISGTLTFADVASLALKTLREHPEIRRLEKKKYRAIMIDEFQDNNEMQKNLLFMLAEKEEREEKGVPDYADVDGRKLFFVGDEKQSIYKFRGADVSVFRSLKDTVGGADGKGNLDLRTNYRSKPELIAAFNTLFGGLPYPPEKGGEAGDAPSIFMTRKRFGDIPKYEAEYSEVLIPEAKLQEADFSKKRMHVALFVDEKDGDEKALTPIETEASFVADKIRMLIDTGIGGRKYRAGEIAILLKRTSNQPVFERMLLAAGIPYSTEIYKGLFGDGPVNDIVSFLALCAYPEDDNALSVLLPSPFINVSVDDAAEFMAAKREIEAKRMESVPPFDEETIGRAGISEEAKARIRETAALYEKIRESAKTEPIAQTISSLWYGLGYRYETMWNRSVSMYATLYDILFEMARKADDKAQSLAGFVDEMRTYAGEQKNVENLDIPFEARDAVKIMTIHKSKGLEFPVVFVAEVNGGKSLDKNDAPVFVTKENGAVINTPPCKAVEEVRSKGHSSTRKNVNYFYDKLKKENDAKSGAELRRLAYVAFTRAAEQLFLTGSYDGDPGKNGSTYLPGSSDGNETGKVPQSIYNIIQPFLTMENMPFTFENIEKKERAQSSPEKTARSDLRENSDGEKAELISALEKTYSTAKKIEPEIDPSPYIAPSKIAAEGDDPESDTKTVFHAESPFQEINEIVRDSIPQETNENGEALEPEFGFSDFGSVAHAFMEAAFTPGKQEPAGVGKFIAALHGNKTKIDAVFGACRKMRDVFLSSEYGKRAKDAGWRRSEFNFRSRIPTAKKGDRIVRGTMDLVFENGDGTMTIVDFKTNQIVEPKMYEGQLALYRHALAQIKGVPEEKIRCVLHYLRHGKSVDITEGCARISVEALALG